VTTAVETEKSAVQAFWNAAPCGVVYANGDDLCAQLESQSEARYRLEPYLADFARFADGADNDVLEIGVGMGADHLQWARARPRNLVGVDLTNAGVEWTRKRFTAFGFTPNVMQADAEHLPFQNDSFDLVYSWGVLHHTPDTPRAINEVHRVLRTGGVARVMIYHARSMVGYALWTKYGLLRGRPFTSMESIYARHLESPGTKAYTRDAARRLFDRFRHVKISVQLSFGDLMLGEAGQRHRGILLSTARQLWPRWFIRRALANHGLYLLIEATK
jgi:SAM-dependent methyltransferase